MSAKVGQTQKVKKTMDLLEEYNGGDSSVLEDIPEAFRAGDNLSLEVADLERVEDTLQSMCERCELDSIDDKPFMSAMAKLANVVQGKCIKTNADKVALMVVHVQELVATYNEKKSLAKSVEQFAVSASCEGSLSKLRQIMNKIRLALKKVAPDQENKALELVASQMEVCGEFVSEVADALCESYKSKVIEEVIAQHDRFGDGSVLHEVFETKLKDLADIEDYGQVYGEWIEKIGVDGTSIFKAAEALDKGSFPFPIAPMWKNNRPSTKPYSDSAKKAFL